MKAALGSAPSLLRVAMTLQQWLEQWEQKSPEVQRRVRVALDFLQKHYGVGRSDEGAQRDTMH